jgi:hypothetical protein
MDSQRLAPFVVTLVAAFALLHPMTTAIRKPGNNSAPASSRPEGRPELAKGEPANLEFPTAQDLVSEFLFSRKGDQAAPSGYPAEAAYNIDFLIATAPDPISSRLPYFFDSFVESLESAAEASGYTLDRFGLPWLEKENGDRDNVPSWHRTLYESVPGLILFRNPQERKLLLVFLVGETPTTGIHKAAMFSALEQVAQFYPWDPKHAELPAGFPQVSPNVSPAPAAQPKTSSPPGSPSGSGSVGAAQKDGATIRIMGPSFSGSAESLRLALDKWSESRRNVPDLRFQIISGTATAIDAQRLSQAAQGHATFQATVPPDDETRQAVACYIGSLGIQKIAILTEDNTVYGQKFVNQSAPGEATKGQNRADCGNGQSPPEILSLPFPMHISRLRAATSKATPQQGQAAPGTGSSNPASASLAQESGAEPREVPPSFADLSVRSAELTLANLLSTISREQYSYVGIVATDVRDVTFLVREVREHCPATVLFTLNSDLLYAYPEVNTATRGMIIITPYPLFNLDQLWTYAFGGDISRLQFSNQAAEGVYNATLALLGQDGKLVDYGKPLAVSANAQTPDPRQPSLWVTAIGNGKALPVRILDWKDCDNYTYLPASSTEARNPLGKPCTGFAPTSAASNKTKTKDPLRKLRVGRGIYAENSVVAFIALSLFIAAFSILMVSQYWRPEKRGSGWISALFGDTASPAYWYDCRLFLLCCCVSLLAFYTVVMVDFCLPFMAARKLGTGIETNATPRIAAGIGILTIVLLLVSILAVVSAFRKSPSSQRVSAPEVVIFSLLGCAFLSVLTAHLGLRWIADVQNSPPSGLFNHLRSFDLTGGLSPLLPLSCVAMGACFWALCSFRRLRLIDVLRATGSCEKPHSWLSFLCLDVRSFSGVRELEDNVKHMLESSSVIPLRWYSLLMVMGLAVGHYFFATRLVRGFEPPPFYWLFEAAFIIIYWALLMEFLRLVFVWRSLHLLLQRLSWHPLLAAVKRYRELRPNLAKMNLTHPPSVFAELESSVQQAGRLVRTAKNLAEATDTDEGARKLFRQSLPEWEAQAECAASQLCEALQLQWTDASRIDPPSSAEMVRKKRATQIQGNWRQSLKSRCHAHHALFRLLQSLRKPMEDYWSSLHTEGPVTAPPADVKEFFDQAEEFIVSRLVNFLAMVFPSLQNLGYFVLAGLLLMLVAVTSYPFQPRNEFLFFNWVVILSFIGTVIWIFVQMDRDTVLSLLNDTKPGEVNFSRELVVRTLLYVAAPLLALLGAQFPESLRQILSLFTAGQGSP